MTNGLAPDAVTAALARDWIVRLAARLHAGQPELDALDAAIGDGDHGTTMSRGAARAVASLPADANDAATIVRAAGRAFLGMGGASGAVYGTLLAAVARAFEDHKPVDGPGFAAALARARDAVSERTGARPGDKTLLDALEPAARAAQASVADDGDLAAIAAAAAVAAAAGAAATKALAARHGRAKFLGAAAIGHEDPGAVSLAWILAELSAAVNGSREADQTERGKVDRRT